MNVNVRMGRRQAESLFKLIFHRYPDEEWGTFAAFGWRICSDGSVIVTLRQILTPLDGDLRKDVSNVNFTDQYILKTATTAEKENYALGVIHSHPQGFCTGPSHVDDDMDEYFCNLFSGFTPMRPYISLIFAQDRTGRLSASGKININEDWRSVSRFFVEGYLSSLYNYDPPSRLSSRHRKVARLTSALGLESSAQLQQAKVGVVGASGTGSPAIEILVRAGVGNLVVIDPDIFEESNLERVHGSGDSDCDKPKSKVELAIRHAKFINPECNVTGVLGRIPQSATIDLLSTCDFVLGCTDKHHSRLALSDIALRYCIPAIDCGVLLEGADGVISGQIIQLSAFGPDEPCALCRDMVSQVRLAQELMSESERQQRMAAARAGGGQAHNPYWQDIPQLLTVGYLTATAAGLATSYVIGALTGTFSPPFRRIQMDLQGKDFGVVEPVDTRRERCACNRLAGTADQGAADKLISVPSHWEMEKVLC